jgi:hypothetical protein
MQNRQYRLEQQRSIDQSGQRMPAGGDMERNMAPVLSSTRGPGYS